jgi:saccharopine dehydrogenase (NAD+, L-lysine-forming)
MEEKIIYIRKEKINNDYRTPLIPRHIKILINSGFVIYIQDSIDRIYNNDQYVENGCIVTNEEWYAPIFKNAIIIGIKELKDLDKLSNHVHIYFSHTLKHQFNSEKILSRFINSNSKLYDFEYILDDNKKRVIAFGYYSGLVGGILGLKQYYNKINNIESLSNLKPWSSFDQMINYVKYTLIKDVKIAVVGANGRCGNGVRYILDYLKIDYIIIDRNYDIKKLIEFDIIYNCILLDESYEKVWFDKNTIFEKNLVISDISCDYSSKNNPIQLYNKSTNWIEPIYKYNEYVDIIGIDNLPSLLPKESSDFFSEKLLNLLLDFNSDSNNYWKNTIKTYYEKANKYKN